MPAISLDAISGTHIPQTMRVKGNMGRQVGGLRQYP